MDDGGCKCRLRRIENTIKLCPHWSKYAFYMFFIRKTKKEGEMSQNVAKTCFLSLHSNAGRGFLGVDGLPHDSQITASR